MSGRGALAAAGVVALLVWGAVPARAADVVHGADAIFAGHGVAIAWGVLRAGPTAQGGATAAGCGSDASTASRTAGAQVILRIASLRPDVGAVTVEAIDPFGGQRVRLLAASALAPVRDVRVPRACFAELPRLEIGLAATADALVAGRAAVVVYFLGVPDTAPEHETEDALSRYLDDALARARGRGPGAGR